MEDKEELSFKELESLMKSLNHHYHSLKHNIRLGYALSPVLSTIDRNSRKAKIYYWQLMETKKQLEATRRSLPSEFNKYLFQIVLAVLDTAHPLPDNLAPVIPYAYFRYCMRYFEAEIAEYEYRHKTDPMKGIRRKRMEAPE